MATTATIVDVDVKPELITYGLYQVSTPDGTDADGQPKFKTELKATSKDTEIEKARAAGTLIHEQTFGYDKAATVAGIAQVIKDAEEASAIFNAGLKTRLNSRVTALLTATDEEGNPTFVPVDGTYDVRDLLNEAAQRRNLSPIEKAAKTLAGLPNMSPELLATLLAQVRANMAPSQE